ncbi:alpha/beta fold hydrolase [Sporomusa rhizae]|uniref:alpha/beta fold hydrolase n=1 Tax=Sporomusa rhizae TaxID=357999 RepID=UPI00352B4DBC
MRVNGIDLNVEIQGNGHPVVLIHGLKMDNTQWKYEIARLNQYCKTVALDCRGHGKSDKPDSYTLKDHIQDIISLMDILNFDVANLYGVSMGSYIAQGVAIAQPDRIKKLILTVPKSNGLTSSTQRLISTHAGELTGLTDREAIKALAKYMVYNPKVRADLADILRTH